jgi:hypothetical protein
MNNDKAFTIPSPSNLDDIGGQSLIGSGFEEEISDNEFTRYDPAPGGGER